VQSAPSSPRKVATPSVEKSRKSMAGQAGYPTSAPAIAVRVIGVPPEIRLAGKYLR